MNSIIYQKLVSDKTLILGERSSLIRPMNLVNNLGQPWTEMRMGMYYSNIGATGTDNAVGAMEAIPQVFGDHTNRVTFGLKDSGQLPPGSGGSSFIGAMTTGSSTCYGQVGTYPGFWYEAYGDNGPGQRRTQLMATYGTASIVGATINDMNFTTANNPGGATLYCGFYGLKFNISNRGASNQTIAISGSSFQPVNMGGHTTAMLSSSLGAPSGGWDGTGSIAWNDGVSAYAIPNSLYVYYPFMACRIRISCLGAWVIS